jgi:uncharacterized protein YndB with AHSA1/START domain
MAPTDASAPEDVVRHSVMVDAPAERAFSFFVELAKWWPAKYTWADKDLETIAIEPRAGGLCYERSSGGRQTRWGRVATWDPPHRLVFTWEISPTRAVERDPARASEVEVRFEDQGEGATRVELEHRGFTRHGEGAAGYREAMNSPAGWPYILERYAGAVG